MMVILQFLIVIVILGVVMVLVIVALPWFAYLLGTYWDWVADYLRRR